MTFYTPEEAARKLKWSKRTIQRKARMIGKKPYESRFSEEDLKAMAGAR